MSHFFLGLGFLHQLNPLDPLTHPRCLASFTTHPPHWSSMLPLPTQPFCLTQLSRFLHFLLLSRHASFTNSIKPCCMTVFRLSSQQIPRHTLHRRHWHCLRCVWHLCSRFLSDGSLCEHNEVCPAGIFMCEFCFGTTPTDCGCSQRTASVECTACASIPGTPLALFEGVCVPACSFGTYGAATMSGNE
jgi:hypothetical protein